MAVKLYVEKKNRRYENTELYPRDLLNEFLQVKNLEHLKIGNSATGSVSHVRFLFIA